MARSAIRAAVLFVVISSVSGCVQGARLVHQDAAGGVIAIPENSNVWPTYYRDSALEVIREHSPNFEIVDQGEFVVGQVTNNNQRVDRRLLGDDKKNNGEIITNANTTTTTDQKEFRITYRVKAPAPGTNPVVPAGGIPRTTNTPSTGSPQGPSFDPRTGQPMKQASSLGDPRLDNR